MEIKTVLTGMNIAFQGRAPRFLSFSLYSVIPFMKRGPVSKTIISPKPR